MASPSPKQILRVPGKLCTAPADLSTAFPHGGTALGIVRAASWAGGEVPVVITAEEYGDVATEVVQAYEPAVFSCIFRGWDTDAVAAAHLDTTAGGTTARMILQGRVTTEDYRAGTLLDGLATALYFSPLADQHPGLLIYRAVPIPDVSRSLEMSAAVEYERGVVWYATPDDTGRIYQVGLRDDLTL